MVIRPAAYVLFGGMAWSVLVLLWGRGSAARTGETGRAGARCWRAFSDARASLQVCVVVWRDMRLQVLRGRGVGCGALLAGLAVASRGFAPAGPLS